MKAEQWVFWALAIYFALMSAVYPYITLKTEGHVEIIGTVVILLTLVFTLMVAGFLYATGRRMDKRPEDRQDGTIAEGAGAYGFFAPSSIWPFWCGLVVMLIFLGWIFGFWLSIIAAGIGVWAVAGWSLQFYRGDYAH
ncbi:Cytochrome c oxidase subunit IV [Raineyella antarctica]|uniref:Cytochrome c oxidase polypeptide 4 n=1 Tax=Raineyella antarctica TaxID=1577474 RepID=A0A1G6GG11_9ACTN|nr:cytochrome c oxidase subunit 4 [Raineyella antarctica]SDB80116.1 Cytochrome c oxidase subunit IV [Raineyella antarctica]